MKKTLFDKVWDTHVISSIKHGPDILYIDKHLIHEVTSPQAFNMLKDKGISLFRPQQVVATADHNVPTENQHLPIQDALSRKQVSQLSKNCKEYGVELFGLGHPFQGIVHVIGPELGVTQPGMTMVCGDSHSSTHGAFGTIAFGIGTSQVAQVFASQCVLVDKPKSMRVVVSGKLHPAVEPKDVVLYVIVKLGTNAGTGHFVEFAGNVFEEMSMEGRMTVCNLSIEMGARGGMIAPDNKTFEYMKGREYSPKDQEWDQAINYWSSLKTDEGAIFDKEYNFKGEEIEPMITYGTNPGMAIPISKSIPSSKKSDSKLSYQKALDYMDFSEGDKMIGKKIDYVFLGSCTNGRIEDFRTFATIIKGKRKADNVDAWLVPGSHKVLKSIKDEGILDTLTESGFKLREPGCSACLAMNDDKIPKGKYAVSTTNRNFEGRQGPGARTLLASPLVAAATAITGQITDPREII